MKIDWHIDTIDNDSDNTYSMSSTSTKVFEIENLLKRSMHSIALRYLVLLLVSNLS